MAYAITEVNRLEERNWVYHDEPRKVAYISGLFIVIATAALVITHILQNAHTAFIYQLIAVVFVITVVLFMTRGGTIIEIDRREELVTKTNWLLFFRRSRSYPLHDFNTIRLVEQVKTIEEGYLDIFYTIVLQGQERSFELLSVNDAKKGLPICKEIISFFALSGIELSFQEVKDTHKIERLR